MPRRPARARAVETKENLESLIAFPPRAPCALHPATEHALISVAKTLLLPRCALVSHIRCEPETETKDAEASEEAAAEQQN